MGDWQLLWEAGSNDTDRRTASGDTNLDLISGEAFSNHSVLVAWIDNNINNEGKFMYVETARFVSAFSTTDSGGGWVDWSDTGFIGLKYLDDDTFRKTGGGMGLRKLYGINNASVAAIQGVAGPTGATGPAGVGAQGPEGVAGPPGSDALADGVVTAFTVSGHLVTATRSNSLIDLPFTVPYEVIQPDTNGQLPTFTSADLGRIARDHGNLRIVGSEVLGTTNRVITLDPNHYSGTAGTNTECVGTAPSNVGDRCFARVTHTWWIRVAAGWTANAAAPSGWIGSYSTTRQAEDAVTANNQIFYVTGSAWIEQVTTFTAQTTEYAYRAEPEQERSALLTAKCPTPGMANAGEYCRVNAQGDAYESGVITIPDETIYVSPANVLPHTPFDANRIVLGGTAAPVDGQVYVFIAEWANTGPTNVRIGPTEYGILKSAEVGGASVFESLEGGEFADDLPVGLLYAGNTVYWTGTLLGNAAKYDVGAISGELAALATNGDFPLTVLPLTTMFTRTPIDISMPEDESDDIGATRRSIAAALDTAGVAGVTIGGSGTTVTVTVVRPGGATSTSTYDLALLDSLAALETILQQLIEASGFHPGHDLVLADAVDMRAFVHTGINFQKSSVQFVDGQPHIFGYDTLGSDTGIYFDDAKIGDLPASTATGGQYGGATRIAIVGNLTDRLAWVDGDEIKVIGVGETDKPLPNNWRTLCSIPAEWVSLGLEADDGTPDNTFWQMLYNTSSQQVRFCRYVVSAGGSDNNRLSNVVHYTFTAAEINAAFPDDVAPDLTPIHNIADYDGLVDFTVSREHLLMVFANVTPNPDYTQADRITYLLGFEWDLVQPGPTLNIFAAPT